MRTPYKNLHQPVRSKEVFDTGILTDSYFTISCMLPPKLKSIQEANVPPLRGALAGMFLSLKHNEVCFTPLKKYCLSIALCYA